MLFKTSDDFLAESNDPIFNALFTVLQKVYDGKPVTDEGTRLSIADAFHEMSLTENEPSAEDIQAIYDAAASILKTLRRPKESWNGMPTTSAIWQTSWKRISLSIIRSRVSRSMTRMTAFAMHPKNAAHIAE